MVMGIEVSNFIIITIDGPALSGKSTLAEQLAFKLGYYYINSGLLYRAFTYILIEKLNLSLDEALVLTKEKILNYISLKDIDYSYIKANNIGPKILYKGQDITDNLKTSNMDQASSVLSTNLFLRDILTDYQRLLAQNNSVILEGRDSGSVVFPYANYKFYLTASLESRVKRLLKSKNEITELDFNESKKLILQRDIRDRQRKIAPLIIPENAILIDNSNLSLNETLSLIISKIS